ncbi:Macrolide export ATP-binding/permease protein MacB [Sedimentisphaera cyanobacteriorum]|uniref:Macrolide export ATP-binding/permease protein MacB n=1 Tax=Sedimentisphaera cyanobacteriorum TaxID=1940790 RepID=A0A1Q2HNM2_9BACT|nr:ABC transporter permease [Sedimentisphaera cyanobacteriorum]AQQ09068.1 Macrolide export ATP-binding/permease protein MacB [Sedimentisphaera cyanobacteriorum]
MKLSDLYGLSLHNLFKHKVRSGLTSLGVIFGTASVIAMLAISEGAREESLAQIQSMGIENIIVYSKKPSDVGSETSGQNQSMVEQFGITDKDLQHFRMLDNIDKITTVTDTRMEVRSGTALLDLKLVGAERTFLDSTSAELIRGRWLSPVDAETQSRICVVGKNVKRKYFGLDCRNVIGRTIRAKNSIWRVVGEIEDSSGSELANLGSVNDMIIAPQKTITDLYDGYSYDMKRLSVNITVVHYDLIIAKVKELKFINNTARRLKNYMVKVHKDQKDWEVIVPFSLFKQRQKTQQIFTVVMGSIAGISLIVGGVGIMNIMLASVYERRKEIGTRRALGAKKEDILLQFLVETVTLTALGSVVGIATGIGLAESVSYYAGWPVVYSYWIMIVAFAIACSIGIVFGTYPAMKAAKQNPIEVLRAE